MLIGFRESNDTYLAVYVDPTNGDNGVYLETTADGQKIQLAGVITWELQDAENDGGLS